MYEYEYGYIVFIEIHLIHDIFDGDFLKKSSILIQETVCSDGDAIMHCAIWKMLTEATFSQINFLLIFLIIY